MALRTSSRGSARVALRMLTAALAALSVVVPAAVASPAEKATARTAAIDANLLRQLEAGPATAILTWDRHAASRGQIDAYLARKGIDAFTFDNLSAAVACAPTSADVAAMSRAPGAVSVWGNQELTPTIDKSVPAAFNGGLAGVRAQGLTGKGIGIAVLDTGLDARHPDLAYNTRVKLNVRVLVSHRELLGGGDPPPCQDYYTDSMEDTETVSGHGTHLAGVAAGDGTASNGQFKGMAPEADLLGVQMTEAVSVTMQDEVAGSKLNLVGALAGINFILSKGIENGPLSVKVALMGWSGKGLHDPWHPLVLAARDLYDFGISTVFPTGNAGPAASKCDAIETCTFNPLAVGSGIAVGATGKDMSSRTVLASYSSRGDPVPRERHDEVFRYEPTIVAPGTDVVSARRVGVTPYASAPSQYSNLAGGPSGGPPGTDRNYVSITGTSVAAAHVAGAVAVMQQAAISVKDCYLSPAQVKGILRQTATPMSNPSHEAGAGALDAAKAVELARTTPIDPLIHHGEGWMCPPQGIVLNPLASQVLGERAAASNGQALAVGGSITDPVRCPNAECSIESAHLRQLDANGQDIGSNIPVTATLSGGRASGSVTTSYHPSARSIVLVAALRSSVASWTATSPALEVDNILPKILEGRVSAADRKTVVITFSEPVDFRIGTFPIDWTCGNRTGGAFSDAQQMAANEVRLTSTTEWAAGEKSVCSYGPRDPAHDRVGLNVAAPAAFTVTSEA